MPFPLIPVVVGAVSFAVGALAASRIKSVAGLNARLGETCRVTMGDGKVFEGVLQDVAKSTLAMDLGGQRVISLPLQDIAGVEVLVS